MERVQEDDCYVRPSRAARSYISTQQGTLPCHNDTSPSTVLDPCLSIILSNLLADLCHPRKGH